MSAKSRAALIPAIPPPMTMTCFVMGSSIGFNGSRSRALAMAILTVSFAFSVAASGVALWQ